MKRLWQKIGKDERAISNTVGALIMVSLAIIFAVAVATIAGKYIPHGSTPIATLSVKDDPCNVTLGPYSFDIECVDHQGGPALTLGNLRCVVLNSSNYVIYNRIIGNDPGHFKFPDDMYTASKSWSQKVLAPGETLYALNTTISSKPGTYTIKIIWVPTHKVLVQNTIQIN